MSDLKINPPPTTIPFLDKDGNPAQAWTQWALQVHTQSKYKGADTTANRPTNALNDGDQFLDTDLGHMIFYYNGGWINAAGTTV